MAWTRERNGRHIGLFYDPSGKERSAGTFDLKSEALKAAADKETDIRRGDYVARSGTTLAEFAVPYLERQTIASIDTDRQYWRKHIEPMFGDWKIDRITTGDIQDFIDAKADTGYQRGTREKMRNLLSKLMVAALKQSPPLIRHNPVPGVQIGNAGAQVDRPYPTPDAFRAIVTNLDDDQDRLMVQTFYACGPRASELVRLEAQHLYPDTQKLFLPGTKSDVAPRTVPVPGPLCAELTGLCAARDPGDPLFMSVTGRPMNMGNWRKRTYNPAREQAGVADNVDLHALRHGALTNWARTHTAKSLVQLMQWSGHKSLRMVMRYQHFYDDIEAGVADPIADLMAGPRPADVVPMRRRSL